MRVVYRSRRARRGAATVYEQAAVEFCCPEMSQRWGVLIGFGAQGCPASTDRNINLYRDQSQASGRSVLELIPVAFCSFCGEPVKTRRVPHARISETPGRDAAPCGRRKSPP